MCMKQKSYKLAGLGCNTFIFSSFHPWILWELSMQKVGRVDNFFMKLV